MGFLLQIQSKARKLFCTVYVMVLSLVTEKWGCECCTKKKHCYGVDFAMKEYAHYAKVKTRVKCKISIMVSMNYT